MAREKRQAALKQIKYSESLASSDEDDSTVGGDEASPSIGKSIGKSRRTSRGADGDDEDYRDGDELPLKKQRRGSSGSAGKLKAKGKGKGYAGKLQSLQGLPLDVWYLIAAHLDPMTLLNMSRANRAMHNLFAKRSAISVWNVVKRSVDLPDLEATDLTDMALTSLLFERNCHLCGRARSVIVDYALRSCQKQNLLSLPRLRREVKILHPKTDICCAFTLHAASGHNWSGTRYYLKPDFIAINDRLHELSDTVKNTSGKVATKEAEDELEAFVEKRKTIVAAALKDATTLLSWERLTAHDRREADVEARAARRDAIEQRLLSLGYEHQDVLRMRTKYQLTHLFDQPAALTDTIWNRISPELIQVVESNKSYRLALESEIRKFDRLDLIHPYYNALRDSEPNSTRPTFPSFRVFAEMPSVKVFWEADDSTVDDTTWCAATSTIAAEVVKTRRAVKLGYARLLTSGLDQAGSPISPEFSPE
ncbi:hypothetical protein JCM1840_003151 [Sporobolomyces johnsonii]